MIKVVKLERSLVPGRVVATVEANKAESVDVGHLLGTKRFWMDRGERVRLRIPKSWCLREGDTVELERLVIHAQTKFSWSWV
jgi:hypothetical protein